MRPVRLSPLLRPQSPSAVLLLLQRLLRQKGGVHPAPLAEAAARPPALPAHACFVLALAATSQAESGCAMTASVLAGAAFPPSPRGGVGSGAAAAGSLSAAWVPCFLRSWLRPRRRAGPARMTEAVPRCTRWAGKGVRCRGRQGALTSRARHSRDSRLHEPRASRAGSSRLRRAGARARTPSSGLGCSLLCSRPREAYFDGRHSRLAGGQ